MPILKVKDENGNWIDLATANTHEHAISDITGLPASIVDDVEALKDKVGAESVAYQINSVLKSSEYVHPFTHPADMITGLSDVAISGSYADLKDAPDISGLSGQVQADWKQDDATAPDYIKNKPDISGLSGQVQADWKQTNESASDYIKNKPVIPDEYTHPNTHPASMIEGLAGVATSGNYNDLNNKPTIPSIEGLASIEYVDQKFESVGSSGGGMTEQVQADWDETDTTSPAYIKNKPVISAGGGASVQANWEQTDETQADFIKNKPFYECGRLTEILPLTRYSDFVFEPDLQAYSKSTPSEYTLTIGETYTVFWDGTSYECVAQDASTISPDSLVFGDATRLGLSGNDEPFLVYIAYGYDTYYALTDTEAGGSHIIGVKQKETLIKKLDPKFSPVPYFGESTSKSFNLIPTSILKFTFVEDIGYVHNFSISEEQAKLWYSDWQTANVILDGIEYICMPYLLEGVKILMHDMFVIHMTSDSDSQVHICSIRSLTDSAENIYIDHVWSSVHFSLVDGQNYYACTDEIRTIPLVDGTKYYIKWNYNYYEDIEAKSYTSSEATYIAVGNPSILGLGDDNGKEFFIYTKTLPDGTQKSGIVTTSSISETSFAIYYAPKTEHNLEVTVNKKEIITIDPKYIKGISWNKITDKPFGTIPSGTVIVDKTTANFDIPIDNDLFATMIDELDITAGYQYEIEFDGNTYTGIAMYTTGMTVIQIESENLLILVAKDFLGQIGTNGITSNISGEHTFKITLTEDIIKTIDPKFIPGISLPEVSSADAGKVLRVSSDGTWVVEAL